MVARQFTIPITEVSDLEVFCPECETSFTLGLEGKRWLPPSCPVCEEVFGPRFTEVLQDYVRFLETAEAVGVEVSFCIDANDPRREEDQSAGSELAAGA
jgi:citrate lyase beta subunit